MIPCPTCGQKELVILDDDGSLFHYDGEPRRDGKISKCYATGPRRGDPSPPLVYREGWGWVRDEKKGNGD